MLLRVSLFSFILVVEIEKHRRLEMEYFTKMYFDHGNEYVIYNSEWDEIHRTNSREENRLEMERLTGDSYA